jgi:trk system potassium uptake protein TrkH
LGGRTSRLPVILDGLGLVLVVVSVAFLGPIWTGVWFHEDIGTVLAAYGVPLAICLALGLSLRLLMHGRYGDIRPAEAMVMVALAWLVIATISAIPFLAIGVIKSPVDAFFESMSGWSSTGATVMVGLDHMDKSILLWRALSQWLGGMGVIVTAVAILSRFFGGRAKPLMMQAEIAGHQVTRMAPRLEQTARLLWGIYIFFSIIGIAALAIVGHFTSPRMGLFDAICHVFAAIPGGGFGTKDASVGYWNSPAIEFVLIMVMLVGAINFTLHYKALTGDWRSYYKDPEFRFFMLFLAFAIVFITGDLAVRNIYPIAESFRYSAFHVVSMITTTGFASADFARWPYASQFLLMIVAILGSMMGSTSGALKMVRVMVVLKSMRMLIQKAIHGHGVFYVKIGNTRLTDEQVANTLTYVLLYVITLGVGTIILAATGADLVTSSSATVVCLGNTGPGLAMVGPATTYAILSPVAKFTLSIIMWLGRLEILGCLLLFHPSVLKD